MTDNEIIKAWECCVIKGSCAGCPYKKHWQSFSSQCLDMRLEDTFDLINRQKAEIERLQLEKADVERDLRVVLDNSVSAKYPHCVLCGNGAILTKSLDEYDKLIADISAEAIKKFAERLQNLILPQLGISTMEKGEAYHFCLNEIDNLVKGWTAESTPDFQND